MGWCCINDGMCLLTLGCKWLWSFSLSLSLSTFLIYFAWGEVSCLAMDSLRQLHEDVHVMGSWGPRPATSGESNEGLKSAGTRVETEVILQPHGTFRWHQPQGPVGTTSWESLRRTELDCSWISGSQNLYEIRDVSCWRLLSLGVICYVATDDVQWAQIFMAWNFCALTPYFKMGS